jgi:hypothetical protein
VRRKRRATSDLEFARNRTHFATLCHTLPPVDKRRCQSGEVAFPQVPERTTKFPELRWHEHRIKGICERKKRQPKVKGNTMAEQNWFSMTGEQRAAKVERQVQAIAIRLMAEDGGLDKTTALDHARKLFGRGKTYPKAVNRGY